MSSTLHVWTNPSCRSPIPTLQKTFVSKKVRSSMKTPNYKNGLSSLKCQPQEFMPGSFFLFPINYWWKPTCLLLMLTTIFSLIIINILITTMIPKTYIFPLLLVLWLILPIISSRQVIELLGTMLSDSNTAKTKNCFSSPECLLTDHKKKKFMKWLIWSLYLLLWDLLYLFWVLKMRMDFGTSLAWTLKPT